MFVRLGCTRTQAAQRAGAALTLALGITTLRKTDVTAAQLVGRLRQADHWLPLGRLIPPAHPHETSAHLLRNNVQPVGGSPLTPTLSRSRQRPDPAARPATSKISKWPATVGTKGPAGTSLVYRR